MKKLDMSPSWIVSLLTFGIARARWIAKTNKHLGQGGARFWFAWLLIGVAHYGLAKRMNTTLHDHGSKTKVSPILCALLTGFPLIGASARLKKGTKAINKALASPAQVPASV